MAQGAAACRAKAIWPGAIGLVQQGLAEFPRDTRLTQLLSTLQKARTDAEEVRSTRGSIAPQPDPSHVASVTETVFIPAPVARVPVPPPPAAVEETVVNPPPPNPPVVAPAPPPRPPAAAAPPVKPLPPAGAPAPPRKGPPKRSLGLIAAGMAAVILVIIGSTMLLTRSKKPATQAVPAPVLAPPVAVEESVNSTLRVFADVEAGKYTLDGGDPADLQDGQVSLDTVPPGPHTLKIKGAREEATIAFHTAQGAAPAIDSVSAKELLAVTVTSMGDKATVHASSGSAKIGVDGKPAGEAGAAGLDLTGLSQGNHQLTLGEGKDFRSMVLSMGKAPMLPAFLKSDRNVGTLVVVTGEDGVQVFLDGKPYRRQTQRGQMRIPNLDVKDYTVRVAKDGFAEASEQRASLRKGEEIKLEFQLKPIPKMASLAIQGAIPGSQVLLDQNVIGTVQDDGSFTASSVPPGEHAIELRKDSYKPRKIDKLFEASQTVQLAAADVTPEKLTGTLKLNVEPAEARITIAREGEAPRVVTDTLLSLPDGTYTLSARAANYQDGTYTVSLVSGDTKTLEISLPRALPKTSRTAGGMGDWDLAGAWKLENGWYVRKGGDFIGYKPASTTGKFVFTVEQRHGKRLQWLAARTDNKNYVLFEVDKRTFYRKQVVGGKETQLQKVPLPAQKDKALTIEITIDNGSIIHRLYDGTKWIVLDDWEEPGRAFGNGKFGLNIPRQRRDGAFEFQLRSKITGVGCGP